MVWHKLVWLLMVTWLVALVLPACGEEEKAPTESATATPTAAATPSPLATGTPTASPSGTAVVTPGEALVLDLAVTAPLLTIFAGEPFPPPTTQPTGDLRHDIAAIAVGDFNDDGLDDLLIGARFADGPDDSREGAGEAYVIFGSRDLKGTIDLGQDEQDLTIFGAKGAGVGVGAADNLGMGVAAGDLNDDGVDDIIVSAPMADGILDPDYRTDRGDVYIIFGDAELSGTIDIAEGEQDVTIISAEGFSLMGDSMATGDVNGDGIVDLILGAPFAGRIPGSPHGGPRTELGEVYVIFGSPTLGGSISIPEKDQDFTISGPEQYSELGDAMAVGDVNGDGMDDIIAVGEAADGPERARPNAGVVYVVFGSEGLGGMVDMAKDEQDLTILGADAQDALGFCASSGDINGDDIDDIVLVAQRADGAGEGRDTSGEAYVIFGSPDLKGTIDILTGDQDMTIFGADPHDLLSSCLAGHDVNDDGIGDIILGTSFGRGPDNQTNGAGEAYVIFGSPDLGQSLDLAQVTYDIVIFGGDGGDRLGGGIATADLNGDGQQEIIVVAVEADGPDNTRIDAGEIYVITATGEGP
jgi:hypothetical protein